MQVKKWSSEALKKEFNGCIDLGEIITHLEDVLMQSGEVICGIRVNGMFLTEEDELKFSKSLTSEIRELEISSQSPNDLIDNSLQSVLDWIPKVRDYSIETAEIFRSEDHIGAQKSFSEILDGCRWLTDALSLLSSVLKKNAIQEEFSDLWDKREAELSKVVQEISSSYESGDFIYLADVLEYELSSSMENWLSLLEPEALSLKDDATLAD